MNKPIPQAPAAPTQGSHTPGKWSFEPMAQYESIGPKVFALKIYSTDPGPEYDFTIAFVRDVDRTTLEANARLIAAAPEMLSALKDAIALLDNRQRGFDPTVSIGDLREQIVAAGDAAIALAEGRS